MLDAHGKRVAFRALHRKSCFVLPNPWDLGSLKRLELLGFSAVASTSAGLAWSLGQQDGAIARDTLLAHLRTLCAATPLPVNADFEAGFADSPEAVTANVTLAMETGIAGLSVEDRKGDELYEKRLAAERIATVRVAIDAADCEAVLVARSEGFLIGQTELRTTIDRLVAYAEAGADCLYAPGITDPGAIRSLVQALAPKPVNVLLASPAMSVTSLAALGVRRISVGSRLAYAAWSGFDEAARMLHDEGTLPARCFTKR